MSVPGDPPVQNPAPTPSAALVVLVTAPASVAASIARTLVEEGRAACVNRTPPVQSTFVWQGRIEEAEEVLLIAKTTGAHYAALERRVRELHPYEVPEILALPVAAGFGPYLEWLNRSVMCA